jgi:hypothetical protein
MSLLKELFQKHGHYTTFYLGAVVTLATIIVWMVWGPADSDAGPASATVLLAVFAFNLLGLLTAIFIHEMGHVFGAWLARITIYTFSVNGRVLYSRRPHLRSSEPTWGYIISLSPVIKKWQLAVLVLSGPFLTLCVSIGVLVLWTLGENWHLFATVESPFFRGILLLCVLLFGVVNLLLFCAGFSNQASSDYQRLVRLIKQPDDEIRKHRIAASFAVLHSLRPRNYPDYALENLRNRQGSEHAFDLMVFWKSFDLGDMDQARLAICRAWQRVWQDQCTDIYSRPVAYEMAMFAARFMNDQDLSRRALRWGEGQGKQDPSRGLAIAARLYARGKTSCAIKVANKATQDFLDASGGDREEQQYGREWAKRIIPELT